MPAAAIASPRPPERRAATDPNEPPDSTIADSRPIDTSPAETIHVAATRSHVARNEMLRPSPRADAATASMPVRLAQCRCTNHPIEAATTTLEAATAHRTTLLSEAAARVGSEKWA